MMHSYNTFVALCGCLVTVVCTNEGEECSLRCESRLLSSKEPNQKYLAFQNTLRSCSYGSDGSETTHSVQ